MLGRYPSWVYSFLVDPTPFKKKDSSDDLNLESILGAGDPLQWQHLFSMLGIFQMIFWKNISKIRGNMTSKLGNIVIEFHQSLNSKSGISRITSFEIPKRRGEEVPVFLYSISACWTKSLSVS